MLIMILEANSHETDAVHLYQMPEAARLVSP
jgi:hypothetical protein